MATDATGTPTAKGIPKYNTAADAPSGLGFNATMDVIDTLLGWVKLRKNSGGADFERGRLNLIEGTGITITVVDDVTNNEVDVTVAAASSELDYTEFTSNVTVTATTEGTANTVVTAGAESFDGATPAIIEFFAAAADPDPGAVGRALLFWLYQDGASIGEIAELITPAASTLRQPVHVSRRLTPASGSRTYSVRASVNAGTAVVRAGVGGAGAAVPGFIRITRA